jgi:hypothetical protein
MSNEVNITEVAKGLLDPGLLLEFYYWKNVSPSRARFFTVVPDAWIPLGNAGEVLFEPNKIDLEIVRAWSTLWVSTDGKLTYQWNVAIKNVGDSTAVFRLLMAETDN